MRLVIKITLIILTALTLGCASKREIKVLVPSGTYIGSNKEGKTVNLTIEQLKHGFRGQGAVKGINNT